MQLTRRRAVGLGLATPLALLTGCTSPVPGTGLGPSPSAATPPPTPPPPSSPPLGLGAATWSGSSDLVQLAGERLVLESASGPEVRVLDVRDGAELWAVEELGVREADGIQLESGRMMAVGAGAEAVLVVAFRERVSARDPAYGVAGLSLDDGSLRWRQVLVPAPGPGRGASRPSVEVAPVQEAVLVHVGDHRVLGEFETGPQRLLRLDPADGRPGWEAADVRAGLVRGSRLLVAGTDVPGQTDPSAGGVAGLDLETGTVRWDDREREPDGRFLGASRSLVPLEGGRSSVLLRLEDGAVVTDPAGAVLTDPAGDLVAWHVYDGERTRVVTLDGTEPAPVEVVTTDVDGLSLDSLHSGYLFWTDGDQTVATDRHGAVTDADLPGPVVAMTGDWAVVGGVGDRLSVHPRT